MVFGECQVHPSDWMSSDGLFDFSEKRVQARSMMFAAAEFDGMKLPCVDPDLGHWV